MGTFPTMQWGRPSIVWAPPAAPQSKAACNRTLPSVVLMALMHFQQSGAAPVGPVGCWQTGVPEPTGLSCSHCEASSFGGLPGGRKLSHLSAYAGELTATPTDTKVIPSVAANVGPKILIADPLCAAGAVPCRP